VPPILFYSYCTVTVALLVALPVPPEQEIANVVVVEIEIATGFAGSEFCPPLPITELLGSVMLQLVGPTAAQTSVVVPVPESFAGFAMSVTTAFAGVGALGVVGVVVGGTDVVGAALPLGLEPPNILPKSCPRT